MRFNVRLRQPARGDPPTVVYLAQFMNSGRPLLACPRSAAGGRAGSRIRSVCVKRARNPGVLCLIVRIPVILRSLTAMCTSLPAR